MSRSDQNIYVCSPLTLSEIRDTIVGVATVIQARRARVQDTV